MKSIAAPVFAFAVSALFAACTASRPVSGPPTPADETAYYTTRPTQRLGEKRILPDPINGLGQTNDPHIRVTDIQQTDRYTVLYLSFGSDNKRSTLDFYGSSASDISIQSGAYLVARGGEQKFKLLKADGIPFSPNLANRLIFCYTLSECPILLAILRCMNVKAPARKLAGILLV
jgi:hypothetical protein